MFQYISVSTFCKKHGKDNKYYYNNQTLRQVTLRNVTFRKLYVTNRPCFRMPSLCRRRRGVLFISLVVLSSLLPSAHKNTKAVGTLSNSPWGYKTNY